MLDKFVRNCPNCNNEITYNSVTAYNNANKKKSVCKFCSKEKLKIKKQQRIEKEKNNKHIRICPKCKKEIIYKTKKYLDAANKNNTLCTTCRNPNPRISLIRNCPKCNSIIEYNNLNTFRTHEKQNKECKECKLKSKLQNTSKKYIRICPECEKEIIYKNKFCYEKAKIENIKCKSCNNSMKGKTVYDVWLKKYGKEKADELILLKNQKTKNTWSNKSDEELKNHCNKISNSLIGNKNPMYGKSTYDIWIQKYGEEEAKKRLKQMIKKCKIASSGKNNPMYGKPAPKRSGNGWSGYYKNHYFRSMLELNYLIYLVDNNIKFESGEKIKYAIKYTMNNLERNYFPDYYLIDTNEYIEIKPINLVNSYQNKLKFEAAKNKLGNKYKILTEKEIVKVDLNTIYDLFINNEIIFDKGYDEKFKKYYDKMKGNDIVDRM